MNQWLQVELGIEQLNDRKGLVLCFMENCVSEEIGELIGGDHCCRVHLDNNVEIH
uniref:hypothetical protein n=1 Tax=Synechococcus sp. UW106 TaxID=368495 RepID=UPI001A7E0EAD|nr:hypothetical protein [Synechococcus sp. UW106]